jgi:hypothetical protein
MRQSLSTVSAVLLLTLVAATPASASLADWLDKLGEMSGPGPWIQRVGVSLDIVCVEGQWWKNPALDLPTDDAAALDAAVLIALGTAANNPFKIAKAARERLSKNSADPTVRALRQRAGALFWILRERILAQKGQTVAAYLVSNGYDTEDQNAPEVPLLQKSLTIIINPFCIGDLRKHRLSIGVYTAWFITDTLPASFVYPADTASLSPRINAYPLAATFTTSLPFVSQAHPAILRSWDLAFSAGAIRFQSEDEQRFASFWLAPYFEFPRIKVRPLAAVACQVRKGHCPGQWTGWDLLEVELVRKWLPDYQRQQFGALPGESSREGQWWVRVGVSFKFNNDQTPDTLTP